MSSSPPSSPSSPSSLTPSPASARRSAAEQQRLDEALITLHEHQIAFNQVLGLKVMSVQAGAVRSQLTMRPDLVGHYLYGRLHGGVISATLDTMGGFALMAALGEKFAHETTAEVMQRFSRMGTIDLRVDYLRQGIGKTFTATAEVTRLGGRIGSTLMRMVNDEGVLIATGCGAYVVS
jgi:uncharacterized protein (TIGR00369 family)